MSISPPPVQDGPGGGPARTGALGSAPALSPIPAPQNGFGAEHAWLIAGCALVAALVAAHDRPGLGLSLTGLALVGLTARLTRPADGSPRPRGDRPALALTGGLALVPFLRDSDPAVFFACLGVLGLLTAVATRARSWTALTLAPGAAGLTTLVALPWAVQGSLRLARGHRVPGTWLRGSAAAAGSAVVIGGLLASADDGYAAALSHLVPGWSGFDVATAWFVGGVVAAIGLALAGAGAAAQRWDAAWARLARPRRAHPAAVWAPSLLVTDLLLGGFLILQAARLFPGAEVVRTPGITLAGEARGGFGQLVAVTVVIIAQLCWSGRRAGATTRSRRLFAVLAGGLVLLGIALVVSALARLARLADGYGLSVIRLEGGVVEVWLGALLLLTGCAVLAPRRARPRWTRLEARLPRIAMTSAAAVLLATGLASPDAVVARAAVDRFGDTGRIDVPYLRMLSDDAVPALSRLPEPVRSCVFAGREAEPAGALWGANVSRILAAPTLVSLGAVPADDPRAQLGEQPSGLDPRCADLGR